LIQLIFIKQLRKKLCKEVSHINNSSNGNKTVPKNGKKQRKKRNKFRPTSTWKNFEQQCAELFDSTGKRNPLSGSNNKNDQGGKRHGDIIVPVFTNHGVKYLVEAKLRKSNAVVQRAIETQKEAKGLGIEDWYHLERQNGNNDIYVLAVSKEWMAKIIDFVVSECLIKKEREK